MNIYPYPSYTKKEIIWDALTNLVYIIFLFLFRDEPVFFAVVGFLWALSIAVDVRVYLKRKRGWVAKIDKDFIYFLKEKNKIPLNSIETVNRQVIRGDKKGINIIDKNGRVHSVYLDMLDELQHDELVEFINES